MKEFIAFKGWHFKVQVSTLWFSAHTRLKLVWGFGREIHTTSSEWVVPCWTSRASCLLPFHVNDAILRNLLTIFDSQGQVKRAESAEAQGDLRQI